MKNKEGKPGRLSPGMALGLAAPQTWTAALIPALLGAALARDGAMAEPWLLLSTAAACVLMQSAANVFNDYCDFIKGGDTLENSPDAEEAVLLYRRPEPRMVLYLGFALLLLGGRAVSTIALFVIAFGYANIFPLIFSISIDKMPGKSNELSGLMVTAIVGGAILPPIMGLVADALGSLAGFIVPAAALV